MKPKSKIINSAAVFLLLIFLFGCSEEILEEKPPHLLTTNTLYTSLEGMETGLNGLYSLARKHWGHNKSNARWWIWPRLGTDALCCWQPNGGLFTWIAFWGVHNNPQNYWLNEYFVSLYEVINAANTIINNAEKEGIDWSGGDASPSENKERVIAE